MSAGIEVSESRRSKDHMSDPVSCKAIVLLPSLPQMSAFDGVENEVKIQCEEWIYGLTIISWL